LYDKLSNNNINNNNNNVSVIQVHVLKLTAHRALILYNVYIAVLTLVTADEDSVLFVDQQQLTQYTHFSQTRVILVLSDVNVLFVHESNKNSSAVVHQCNSDSESECVDF